MILNPSGILSLSKDFRFIGKRYISLVSELGLSPKSDIEKRTGEKTILK